MERPEFTDEERALILAVASGSDSKLERILGHLPWIAPGIAFIIYGALSGQLHAVTIGALSILLYQLWGLVQELRYSALYTAIFRKIARQLDEPRQDTPEQH
ncbi:hypothetical protein VUJ49_12300 [Pseudomonas berkeleyensis]|uniref:Uncharacterized protein n=1 Tax=Pseudomonas berkeleyensis TaxID=2726956 RepID=A0A7G5DVK4_9PSED|nr:hypothetical protein [Pseudomonas berkeleyensis]QMV65779.1 hypothetical protein HS968_12255 [Pseudomonas berkeleyensis]WSO41264.1 hypothetical protein VUJ49_12300 [Pseudomonas berkeleyensis]